MSGRRSVRCDRAPFAFWRDLDGCAGTSPDSVFDTGTRTPFGQMDVSSIDDLGRDIDPDRQTVVQRRSRAAARRPGRFSIQTAKNAPSMASSGYDGPIARIVFPSGRSVSLSKIQSVMTSPTRKGNRVAENPRRVGRPGRGSGDFWQRGVGHRDLCQCRNLVDEPGDCLSPAIDMPHDKPIHDLVSCGGPGRAPAPIHRDLARLRSRDTMRPPHHRKTSPEATTAPETHGAESAHVRDRTKVPTQWQAAAAAWSWTNM